MSKKLVGLDTLNKALELLELGVPMTKVHVTVGLDKVWSYGSTVIVLTCARNGHLPAVLPPWLKDAPILQEPPVNWVFRGNFPIGKWHQLDISTDEPVAE